MRWYGCLVLLWLLWGPSVGMTAPTTRPSNSNPTTKSVSLTTRPASRPTRHYTRQLRQLHELIRKTASREEKAILKGLAWMTKYVEPEEVFEAIFCEYLFVVKTIHLHRKKAPLGAILQALGHISAKRVQKRLPKYFEKKLSGKWEFFNVLPMLLQYKASIPVLSAFYKRHFPSSLAFSIHTSYATARKKGDMDTIIDYVLEASFLHYLRKKYPKLPFKLPPDLYPSFMQQLKGLPFPHRYRKNKLKYSLQNYFLTHVNAALTNYGEFPQASTPLTRRIWKYWKREWKTIRDKVGDFDLMAEVVFCFKLYGKAHLPVYKTGLTKILNSQNSNGSWGRKKTENDTYYEAIHPTWTAITALVTPNRKPRKKKK